MNIKTQLQNYSNERLLKIILENNNVYTDEAMIDIVNMLKERGDASKIVLENYSVEKLIELMITKKDYNQETQKMLSAICTEDLNALTKFIKTEKEIVGEIKLLIKGVKVDEITVNLIGDLFVTNEALYYVSTKISKQSSIPTSFGAGFMSGGALLGGLGYAVGLAVDQLINKPAVHDTRSDMPLSSLVKYVEGSFKIKFSDIQLMSLNNKSNGFLVKNMDDKWAQCFFVQNVGDRDILMEMLIQHGVQVVLTKGFIGAVMDWHKEKVK